MADSDDPKLEASAEKAYASAAEAVPVRDIPEVADAPVSAEPAETPAKPKRGRKPRTVAGVPIAAATVADEPAAETMTAPDAVDDLAAEAAVEAPVAEAQPVADVVPAVAAPPKQRQRIAAKPAPTRAKPSARRAVARPAPAASSKPSPLPARKPAGQKIKTASKTVTKAVPKKPSLIAQRKETTMDETSTFQAAVDGAQEKTKDAFTKATAFVGEYGEFAKGNVEAFVESGKILASGLQDFGSKFIADSKAAIETMTGEVKELSAAKTPTDFFKIQTDLMRRNFDSAIAYGSKTGEAMLKLTNEVIAPISGRVNLAVEKVRKAA